MAEIKKNIIQTIVEQKGNILAGSGTMFSFGAYTLSYETVILSLAGFIVAIFSFHYDFTHSEKKKSVGALVSEAVRHLLFGTLAFPAVYKQIQDYSDLQLQMVIFLSVVISYSVMIFIPFIIEGTKSLISAIANFFVKGMK